jgi:hypothetical protein
VALTGTLKDVPFDEMMSLLHQQSRTGSFTLQLGNHQVVISFREGQICQVDDDRRNSNMLIGDLLVAGGCVERSDLARALEKRRSNAKPLGAILVGMGSLTTTDLHHYLDLQFRETLYPLFALDEGVFDFDAEGFVPRNCAPPPLLIQDVTMEAVLRIDEMPDIQQWVPNPNISFYRTTRNLTLPEGSPFRDQFGERERKIFAALTQAATPDSLVGKTGMSTFDIMKGAGLLLQAGFIVPMVGSESDSGSARATDGARLPLALQKQPLFDLLLQTSFVLILSVAVLLVGLNSFLSDWEPDGFGRPFDMPYSYVRQFIVENQLEQIDTAVEIYRLEVGEYPNTLGALVQQGLILQEEFYHPDFSDPYHYRRTSVGYLLLPPTR